MDADKAFTSEEAAEHLRIPEETLAYWRRMHLGPRWFRAGRHVRYRVVALNEWMAAQEAEQTAKDAEAVARLSA